jgi:hypothetical protein
VIGLLAALLAGAPAPPPPEEPRVPTAREDVVVTAERADRNGGQPEKALHDPVASKGCAGSQSEVRQAAF